MAQLTLEKAKELLKKLHYAKAQMGQLSLNDEMYKQALEKLIPMWDLDKQESGQGEWIEWHGGLVAPVTGRVDVRYRNGKEEAGHKAGVFSWSKGLGGMTIIAYRVIKP